MTAPHVLLRAAVLGIGCTSLLGASPHEAAAARSRRRLPLILDCHVSGGGYAIRDVGGRTLESGDGVPFSPQPHAILHVTASPPLVLVTEGALPHPDCSSGPVLGGLSPIRFSWCRARYEITLRETGEYLLRSTSTSPLTDGPHRGDVMEAFVVGACLSVNAGGAR